MLVLAASLLLAAAAASAPPEPAVPPAEDPALEEGGTGRDQKYPGWVLLYRVPDLTIVYPAASGEEADTNRLSAERRAATLRALTKAKVEVVTDAALTETQRQGHLLLLGWNNRILTADGRERPFRHGRDAGTRFAGLVEPDASVDLLFLTRSPWNAERWMFFWSRIDPELEMFQSLPAVGSDWAMVDGFRIVRQGMFKPDGAWPPVRDEDAEADHAEAIFEVDKGFVQLRSERYTINYDPAKTPEPDLKKIAASREAALSRAAKELGAPGVDFRVSSFVYPDEAAKLTVTGIGGPAHAIPRERELHMTREAAMTASEHEEIHLVARATLGPCYLNVLYEGLALARQGSVGDAPLDLVAAAVLERNAWPSVSEILDDGAARKLDDGRLLPAAALLLQWVEGVGGKTALAKVMGLREGSAPAFATRRRHGAGRRGGGLPPVGGQARCGAEERARVPQAGAGGRTATRGQRLEGDDRGAGARAGAQAGRPADRVQHRLGPHASQGLREGRGRTAKAHRTGDRARAGDQVRGLRPLSAGAGLRPAGAAPAGGGRVPEGPGASRHHGLAPSGRGSDRCGGDGREFAVGVRHFHFLFSALAAETENGSA